jgi:D-tyrosyl-tRNA(Tyr) deacylase
MKALIQRINRAEVSVASEVVGSSGPGMLILLGVGRGDDEKGAAWLAARCANLRIFDDRKGLLNLSLLETGGEALVVSQFTLYANSRRGRRPSYTDAAEPEEASRLFDVFCEKLREEGVKVEEGSFGERMQVELVNDGPVTLMVETPQK